MKAAVMVAMALAGAGQSWAADLGKGVREIGAGRAGDPLRAAVQCGYSGGLHALDVTHAVPRTKQRTVATASGPMLVSVADRYRMRLAFPGTDPFVQLKLERSLPEQFEADRTAILAQLTWFTAQPKAPQLMVLPARGIEVLGLDEASLSGAGVIGVYMLIVPSSGVVATAYLLRQASSRKAYADYPRYVLLRDRFLSELATCLGGTMPAMPAMPAKSAISAISASPPARSRS